MASTYKSGDLIEVQTSGGKWYPATVKSARGEKVRFLFAGTDEPADSWIEFVRPVAAKAAPVDLHKKGTTVYTIYGAVAEYVRALPSGKHQLKDSLGGDKFSLEAHEFYASRAKAWGRKRSV